MKNNKYPQLPLLLYDDQCTLCKRFKEALLRLPGGEALSFESIHNDNIYNFYPQLTFEKCHNELHFIDTNGAIFCGSEAITQLAKEFPGVAKFSWLIESGMGQRAIHYFYKMADSYRKSLLNRCPTCK